MPADASNSVATMAEFPTCSKCGIALPEGAPQGFCPRCLMQAGLAETAVTVETFSRPSLPNRQVGLPDFGAYHAIGVLGEGGMGIVYLAEQREPIRRRVALKVLKRSDDPP